MNGRGEFFKEELLSGYLDGELSDGQRRYVERMLDQDPEIRGKYQALSALSDRLRGLDRHRLSDEAAQRVSAVVETALSDGTYGAASQPSDDELIGAYVDGELSESERAAVEQRMEQDERQRRLFERLCTLQRRLALLPTYRLDEDFAARVVRQIESLSPAESEQSVELAVAVRRDAGSSDRTRRARALNLRGVVWAVAAIATAILLMVFVPRGGNQNGPPVAGSGTVVPGHHPSDHPDDSTAVAGGPTDRDAVADGQPSQDVDTPTVTPRVMPPGTANSPFALISSLRRTRLVLVYEILVTEEGVRNAAFSNLLRRHGIGFTETSAIGREEQKDLLRHRFLENVQVADDRRAEMDRVDLFLVRTKGLTADALYRDLMARPAGIGGFSLNLTTRDAESRVLNRLCESSGVEDKVGQAVRLLANFGILSRTGRNLGAFGTMSVDPALYTIPKPRPAQLPELGVQEGEIGPPNLADDFQAQEPPPIPLDFACELLFVVRQSGVVPEAPADISDTRS